MYRTREGHSGISGALHEIKLISLFYFRALHDYTIEDFQLAANVGNMGYFDDICYSVKAKGFHKPVAVFIQAKHRKGKNLTLDLIGHFVSYLRIIKQFDPRNDVPFLKGTFDEIECFFVIYTIGTVTDGTATCHDSIGMPFSAKLYDLIGTGGIVKQLYNTEDRVKFLAEVAMKIQIVSLAERIAKLIIDDSNFELLLSDDTVLQFHVILARKVVDVSEIRPEGYRAATFRADFFDTNEDYLTIFKDNLFKDILKNRNIESTDIKTSLSQLLADPTDVINLSKVIETAVTYNNGLLEINKKYTQYSSPQLKQVHVSQMTVNHARELAAKEILSYRHFRVPAAFGNKDLIIRGSDAKIDRRITYLVYAITRLLESCEPSKIVTIDKSLENGFLQLHGGITGAIGNIFVLDDDNSKLMKITDKPEQLGPVAKRLYTQLNRQIHNLHEYKFCFTLNRCPILSFESNYYENLAKDFLNRLLFYSNQADDDGVEQILKEEIEDYQSDQTDYFQVKVDVIFSRYFDLTQKWWLQRHEAPYLTRKNNLFRQSINDIIKEPLMSSINVICKSKIKKYGYTFNEDVVRSLNLQDECMSTVIIAENSLLTVTKVMQHLKNKNHVVLDFVYIADLPPDDRNSLCTELTNTNKKKVLILVCDVTNAINDNDIRSLEIIADAVRYKKTIVVTNKTTFKMLQTYFPKADKMIQDKKLSLIDLSEESQMSIFETATAIFPGVEIRLDQLLRGCPKPGSE